MPTLAQTLHGYDQGHRLLASGGDLDARELALLDRLSDLSGYLPTGTRFDHYFTGFPCGRYYALGCTWADLAATRAGTVLTHTLLLPREETGGLEDPWGLTRMHRRPHSAGDRAAYQTTLQIPELLTAPGESPSVEEKAAAVVLLLGTSERPILWVDERPPEPIVRYLWSLLRPAQREHFAFCTFALQTRSVEGRVFDFLGMPPAARGSFLDRARSEAWWDSGQLLHSRLVGLTQQPWTQELASAGAEPLRRIEALCEAQGLPPPPAKDFTTLWRFMSLESAASERLAAARSRADLFERLWPQVKPAHAAVESILRALLDRQADAALEPRPLWELTDFLKRPLVQGRRAVDPRFAADVERVLVREFERRFIQVPERTAQELPELLAALGPQGSPAILMPLGRVLSTREDAAQRLAPALLRVAAASRWPELTDTTLRALSTSDRARSLDAALQQEQAPTREALLSLADEAADRIDDLELLLFIGKQRGQELEALQRVTRKVLARDASTAEAKLSPLLADLPAAVRLSWALGAGADSRLSWFSAQEGVHAARTLELDPEALVQRCMEQPNGARVLLLFAKEHPTPEPLARALRPRPSLALKLVVLTLGEEGSRMEQLTRIAAELVPSEQLLSPALRQALLSQGRSRGQALVDRLGPQWIRALCAEEQPLDELVTWLDVPSLRQWLQSASTARLLDATPAQDEEWLLPRLATAMSTWTERAEAYDTTWIRRVVDRLLYQPSAQAFDAACRSLARLLRAVPTLLYSDALIDDLMALAARTKGRSGWHIVEIVFPRYYARACRAEKSLLNAFASFFTGEDWDKAKPVRRWLIDTYVHCDWPPESFLRALDGDVPLFFRLVHRAAKTSEGMRYLRRLPSALDADPRLASRWRRPIEEALAHPHRAVDFE